MPWIDFDDEDKNDNDGDEDEDQMMMMMTLLKSKDLVSNSIRMLAPCPICKIRFSY